MVTSRDGAFLSEFSPTTNHLCNRSFGRLAVQSRYRIHVTSMIYCSSPRAPLLSRCPAVLLAPPDKGKRRPFPRFDPDPAPQGRDRRLFRPPPTPPALVIQGKKDSQRQARAAVGFRRSVPDSGVLTPAAGKQTTARPPSRPAHPGETRLARRQEDKRKHRFSELTARWPTPPRSSRRRRARKPRRAASSMRTRTTSLRPRRPARRGMRAATRPRRTSPSRARTAAGRRGGRSRLRPGDGTRSSCSTWKS